ncbi:hypothetical protein [Ktedonobacter racemifer]|uniref:Uncharacterized protein n=1 Tax=Ktedonobacter racemifer DSM 44963 TaxID=485913 RepID=D6TEW8_KTERA|nr:hypothetical protein [Ktedonobacter racemifer]EFH88567.1 hypothetical protein Krac_10043 [Ktedonobacter racemifer DSM 44963]
MPKGKKHVEPVHQSGTGKGEEAMQKTGQEAGRHDTGISGAQRRTGKASGRFSTGINPKKEEPIDPNSPYLPAP